MRENYLELIWNLELGAWNFTGEGVEFSSIKLVYLH